MSGGKNGANRKNLSKRQNEAVAGPWFESGSAPRDPHNTNHPEIVIKGQPINLEKHTQSSRNKDLTLPRVCDIR